MEEHIKKIESDLDDLYRKMRDIMDLVKNIQNFQTILRKQLDMLIKECELRTKKIDESTEIDSEHRLISG